MFAVKFTSRNEVTIPIVLLVLTVFWSLLLSSEELSDTVKQGISDPESNPICTDPAADLLKACNNRVSGSPCRKKCAQSHRQKQLYHTDTVAIDVCREAANLRQCATSPTPTLVFRRTHTVFERPAPTRSFKFLHPFSHSEKYFAEMGATCWQVHGHEGNLFLVDAYDIDYLYVLVFSMLWPEKYSRVAKLTGPE